MPTRDTKFDNELSLPEMLADPIVQAVMARDGVTREELEGLIGTVRRKPANRQIEHSQVIRQGPGTLSPTE